MQQWYTFVSIWKYIHNNQNILNSKLSLLWNSKLRMIWKKNIFIMTYVTNICNTGAEKNLLLLLTLNYPSVCQLWVAFKYILSMQFYQLLRHCSYKARVIGVRDHIPSVHLKSFINIPCPSKCLAMRDDWCFSVAVVRKGAEGYARGAVSERACLNNTNVILPRMKTQEGSLNWSQH